VAFGRCRENRGGTPTGERARSGGSAQADHFVARRRARWHGVMKHCVCRRSASFSFFFSFVIAGLDPAIHAAKRLEQNLDRLTSLHISMDHRVKPGGDEEKGCLTIWAGNSRADAPRER
jgi:hypothetical protein